MALLRALSIRPDVLLLDEPCNGLDAEVKREFLLKLRNLVHENQIMTLYVTHHRSEVQFISDEIIYLIKKGSNGIKNKVQAETGRFIDAPPAFEAAQVFRFPDFNSVRCEIAKGQIRITESHSAGRMVFPPEAAQLSNNFGFGYKIVNQTEMYSEVLVGSGDILVLKLPKAEVAGNRYVFFTGRVLEYDPDGILVRAIEVRRNSVTNE